VNPGFFRNAMIILLSGIIIFLFFLPWLYLEIAPVTAPQLISLTAEYFKETSVMNQLIYLVFLIPIMSIYILISVLFRKKSGVMAAKIILWLTSFVFFIVIFRFQTSDTMNLNMALACKFTLLLSLVLFMEEIIFRIRENMIKR